MSFKNDAINFAAKYIKSLGLKKSDFDAYGGLENAVYSADFANNYSDIVEISDFATQIFDEITDNVIISDADASAFLKEESFADIVDAFVEYADIQGWDEALDFADELAAVNDIDDFINLVKSDSNVWEDVKLFVSDSIVGDIGLGYRMFDTPEFWNAVEKKL